MSAVQKIEPRQEMAPARSVTPMEMLAQAIDKGASLDIVDKFMDMAERWEKNNQRKAFSAAISAAKSEIPIVARRCCERTATTISYSPTSPTSPARLILS
jgi:hypothetical protein